MASPPQRPRNADTAEAQEALRAWVEDYGPALRRYFEKRVPPAEAEDLVQDVFLSMQVRGQADTVDNARGYLFRVAANVLARRRQGLAAVRPGAAPLDRMVEEISPERVLIAKEALERMVAALEQVPPRAREALLLHRFEEATYASVARRMGISVSAVEQLITRALKQISLALEGRA
jgi:RNA polymerase sigma factor (sigma-70 family)